jgi:hypothetical protein
VAGQPRETFALRLLLGADPRDRWRGNLRGEGQGSDPVTNYFPAVPFSSQTALRTWLGVGGHWRPGWRTWRELFRSPCGLTDTDLIGDRFNMRQDRRLPGASQVMGTQGSDTRDRLPKPALRRQTEVGAKRQVVLAGKARDRAWVTGRDRAPFWVAGPQRAHR